MVWTDGRYYLQAENQLYDSWKLMKVPTDITIEKWLVKNLPRGSRVGIDPFLFSITDAKKYETAFEDYGLQLALVEENLVDAIWENKPAPPSGKCFVLSDEFAGRSVTDKVEDIRKKLKDEDASLLVVNALDEIAWLFNLRGSDIEYNPVFWAYAIITHDNVSLFMDSSKADESVRVHLEKHQVALRPYGEILSDLKSLVSKFDQENERWRVWVDPKCSKAIENAFSGSDTVRKHIHRSPITDQKAKKNDTEIQGMRNCHIRDAAALVRYLAWLELAIEHPDCQLTEVTAADRLDRLRSELAHFVSLSFGTISGFGPNGAIIHYHPMADTCARLGKGMYLVDSGGQYLDGTTDVTRTVHLGTPSERERLCYTAVLKGHIALATVVFPSGTTGLALDAQARLALWKLGLDYNHGTGHGVGSFLNVHEGPHSISFRPSSTAAGIEPNMTVTNEPGYYEAGAFGIRIENVMISRETQTPNQFDGKKFLGFETITFVPLDRKLIDVSALTNEERAWIDHYHAECLQKVMPQLGESEKEARSWLENACRPL
eukprot:TRINITY_DN18471_c0_g1::TRINITY_DN18471_c0_g1_i1::g.2809::m.2809 TRINITY_DN18471_c0_g1::TRINITY_DN18471_c0_g1_i1::g.2809  ORF type:complete len:592 (+),score=155.53,sp/B0DZL3/AMPP1_LACBS/50.42/0.0,Peptidase_M24/PF00557.19/6.8e-39,Peptidase_M24/PF00557.19/3.7e+03,Creatinase_N/PF01321.13/3.2e-14,Creatinase_N/PF01321.13/0.13 TRINITY_DN18471_c0_g1_i1:141-1778(+)